MKRPGLLVLFTALFAPVARAEGILPKGVGAVQMGYRSYAPQSSQFDASGAQTGLGAGFNQEFSGVAMLQSSNLELRRLAGELSTYERGLGEGQSLLRDLSLGTLRGDVQADVSARILGFAFGISKHVTLVAGIPWVSAHVRTKLEMAGQNNALAVRDRLGALAFDELKAGLTRAASLSAASIKKSIADAGYAALDDWQGQGFGDARLGARTALERPAGRNLGILGSAAITAILPTGTPDDPDALTDVKTGNGYFGLEVAAGQRVTLLRTFYLGTDLTYAVNFDAVAERRVPEAGESIVAKDRKARVQLNPGDDADASGYVGAKRWGLDLSYRLGLSRHYSDAYRAALAGDYAALAAGSDRRQVYQRAQVAYDTIAAYKAKAFPVPLLVAVSANDAVSGRNTPRDRYFELSLTGFISTSLAR